MPDCFEKLSTFKFVGGQELFLALIGCILLSFSGTAKVSLSHQNRFLVLQKYSKEEGENGKKGI